MDKSTQFIDKWIPDDQRFWEQIGKKIATRNLWVSIPCLSLGFCVWMLCNGQQNLEIILGSF